MRMGQGVRAGLGHGGITCVLQTQFSSFLFLIKTICCCPSSEPSRQDGSDEGSQHMFYAE